MRRGYEKYNHSLREASILTAFTVLFFFNFLLTRTRLGELGDCLTESSLALL